MPRIAGVVLPDNKRVVIGLTYIYGIGKTRSQKILADARVDESVRVKDLTEDQENAIRQQVEKYRTEGDLQREVYSNIKRLQDINSYRGTRHKKKLPVRGQRTKTNARTRKGKVKTMGSGKIKEQKK